MYIKVQRNKVIVSISQNNSGEYHVIIKDFDGKKYHLKDSNLDWALSEIHEFCGDTMVQAIKMKLKKGDE